MNCRRLRDLMFEYLDGTLSASRRAAVEAHLANCTGCRQELKEHQRLAAMLSERFQGATEALEMPPDLARRLAAAVQEPAMPARGPLTWWPRLAWPIAAAASLGLLLFLVARTDFNGPRNEPSRFAYTQRAERVFVRLPYYVPVYSFRQENGHVVDSLSFRPCLMDQTLQWPKPSTKSPL